MDSQVRGWRPEHKGSNKVSGVIGVIEGGSRRAEIMFTGPGRRLRGTSATVADYRLNGPVSGERNAERA
jgi:hypothetical protein